MLTIHHRQILHTALADQVSPRALDIIAAANVGLDALSGQLGHDEYHFDNNAFDASRAFIESNRALIAPALERGDVEAAWAAFGRLSHTAQDFYAHSNYIRLWMAQFDADTLPPPAAVPHADPGLLRHPDLHSGKLYYPLEALSFIPRLKRFVLPLLPKDSHAWMNLDSPAQGPAYAYAFAAAVKRTQAEWAQTLGALSPAQRVDFTGQD